MNPTILRSLAGVVCAFGFLAMCRAQDTTELLSKTDAAKLQGQPVISVNVIGPEKDDDAPAPGTHWMYRAAAVAIAAKL